MHVLPKVRMIPNAGQDRWVQHLHEEPGNAANHHRGDIAVHFPRDRIWSEESVMASFDRLLAVAAVIEKAAHPFDD